MPVVCTGDGNYEIVKDLVLTKGLELFMKHSANELLEEKELAGKIWHNNKLFNLKLWI